MTTSSECPWKDLDELQPLLRAFLRPRVRDVNDLEDVLQDALLRAARFRAAEGEPEKLQAWILRIAENALSDYRRRRLRLPVREVDADVLDGFEGRERPPGDEPDPSRLVLEQQPIERQHLLACVGSALRELDDADQDVLDNFYGGAGRCREVARELDLAPELVKSRLHRARQRLSLLVLRRLADEDDAASAAAELATDGGAAAVVIASASEVRAALALQDTTERGAKCVALRPKRPGGRRAATKGKS